MGRGDFDRAKIAVTAQRVGQAFQIGVVRDKRNGFTANQWRKHGGNGGVKGDGGMYQRTASFLQGIGLVRPVQVIQQTALRNQRAFGPAGGTRRVNHVSQMFRMNGYVRIFRRLFGNFRPVGVQHNRLGLTFRQRA